MLRRRVRKLIALLRLALALRRSSGISSTHERLLVEAGRGATPSETTPIVLADAGVENVNAQVDELIATGVLRRIFDLAVNEGRFRQDLYYRLKVVALRMPPLRERREDIPLLATFFLTKFSTRCKRRVVGYSDEALACLTRHDWPGNVRELENAIERAVVLGSAERILVDDLPENILEQFEAHDAAVTDYHQAVQTAKQAIVTAALKAADGNYSDAARQLGIHPNNLHRLVRTLGVKGPRPRGG